MLALGMLILGCVALFPLTLANYPTLEGGLDCDSSAITQEEVEFVQSYQKQIFPEREWTTSHLIKEDHVFVARISDPLNAASSIDLIRLCDAATETKKYANTKNIDIIMENYNDYEVTDSCEQNGVLLFELWATAHNESYNGRLWFQPIPQHPHRAIEVFLVFPENDSKNIKKYSSALFPNFSSCK
jgi:hypothetical protein